MSVLAGTTITNFVLIVPGFSAYNYWQTVLLLLVAYYCYQENNKNVEIPRKPGFQAHFPHTPPPLSPKAAAISES